MSSPVLTSLLWRMLIDVQIGLLTSSGTLVITGALVWHLEGSHLEPVELRATNPNSTIADRHVFVI